MRICFLENIRQHLPRNLQDGCDIRLITIDYPTYGGSIDDKAILGTSHLDNQILELFNMLKADDNGLNILWSYSMGTRYACALLRREYVDFAYMQAPFYSISVSSTSLFAAYCTGIEGGGLSLVDGIHRSPNNNRIFLHLGEHDEIFPCSMSLTRMKLLARQYIVQPGKNHMWFDTLEAAEVAAAIMGKEIGELYLKRDLRRKQEEEKAERDQSSSSSVASPS
jgi:hypothetical protein